MAHSFDTSLVQDAPDADDVSAILPLYGGADTAVEDMTDEEREQAAEQVYAKVREQAFSRGLPVIVKKNGRVVKEYADGRIETLD